LLAVVRSGDRTKAKVLECDKAFDNMATEMRYIKKHYFLIPPLTKADFVRLMLPIPDDTCTKIGKPDGQPARDKHIEYMKSKARCKVEHAFAIIKNKFGCRKAVYRGPGKNKARLYMLFRGANLLRLSWSLA
jgi:hypothetical protein